MTMKLDLKETDAGLSVVGTANLPKLQLDSILLENVQTHVDALWKDNILSGSEVAAAVVNGVTWKGKTDFSWENGDSLFLTHAHLQSPTAIASGDLEIRPDKILIGQTSWEIENLQALPFGLYGKLNGKTDWLVSNGKQ